MSLSNIFSCGEMTPNSRMTQTEIKNPWGDFFFSVVKNLVFGQGGGGGCTVHSTTY